MIKFIKTYFSPFSFPLLGLYIFFMFTAQATLFSTVFHSIAMYSMLLGVVICACIQKKMLITEFSIWYVIFFIFSLFSSLFHLHSDINILYPIFVSLIISFCFIQTIDTTSKLEACMNVYVFSAIIMAFMIWKTGQLDYLSFNAYYGGEERLGTEISGNANIFTALFMYSGTFASWFIVYEKRMINRFIYLAAFILILFIMIISGGRKTIIAIMGAFCVFLIMNNSLNKKYILRNIAIAISIVIGIFYAILNVPFLYDLIGERFEGLFNLFTGKGSDVSGDDMRERIFLLAINSWFDRPLLGYGIDSFKFYNQSVTGHFYYAHNNYVELLYDVGIIGFILFYYMYWHIYKNVKSISIDKLKYKVLAYGLLVELLIFDFGGVSYYLVGNIIVLTIAYLCVIIKKV